MVWFNWITLRVRVSLLARSRPSAVMVTQFPMALQFPPLVGPEENLMRYCPPGTSLYVLSKSYPARAIPAAAVDHVVVELCRNHVARSSPVSAIFMAVMVF